MMPAASGPRCMLTVIGGFLGAGKTTFLNRILTTTQGRTAVLVNDFGAVNVDAGLIAGNDGRTLRLTNGCVCCSLADGFIDTLMRVLAEPFEHIIIEASGVADPWAIAEIAMVEPSLALAGVIVLADAARLPALLGDNRVGDTVRTQIRAADIVVLNKIDLVDAAGLAAARAALAAVKPQLRIVDAVDASLPAEVIAGVRLQRERGRGCVQALRRMKPPSAASSTGAKPASMRLAWRPARCHAGVAAAPEGHGRAV